MIFYVNFIYSSEKIDFFENLGVNKFGSGFEFSFFQYRKTDKIKEYIQKNEDKSFNNDFINYIYVFFAMLFSVNYVFGSEL